MCLVTLTSSRWCIVSISARSDHALAMAGVLNLLLRPLTAWAPRLPTPADAGRRAAHNIGGGGGDHRHRLLISVPSGGLAGAGAREPRDRQGAARLSRGADHLSPGCAPQHREYRRGRQCSPPNGGRSRRALPGILLFGTASTLRDMFCDAPHSLFHAVLGRQNVAGAESKVLPRFSDKRRAVEIAGEIQASIASLSADHLPD